MDLFLQYGYGMKAHSEELIKSWGGGCVIFSPKDMTLAQMIDSSKKINDCNGSVCIDPQFYMPHTNKEKLIRHSFWPEIYKTNNFFTSSGISPMISHIVDDYLLPTKSKYFIIPTFYLKELSDDWSVSTELFIREANSSNFDGEKILTLCIDEAFLCNEENLGELFDKTEEYNVDGYYIIADHPQGKYLVNDAAWLLNLLDLCAHLKLLNKKVIVGYSSHQFLLLSLAKIDAIAAGIWLKTRSFPKSDFDDSDDSSIARRKTWYYCPQALSEYQIGFLDIAFKIGILPDLKTPSSFNSKYADILFKGAQPQTTTFSEHLAFRHYLQCLYHQCADSTKNTYQETVDYLRHLFETAYDLTESFKMKGVRGNGRDFYDVAEFNLSAIDAFDSLRGLIYANKWKEI